MNIIEITNAYETAEEAFADWSVLEDPETVKVAERAAYRLSRDYADTGTIEYDDALQEATIILATRPGMVRDCLSSPDLGYGVLYTRLHQALVKVVRTDAKHRTKHTSYESALDAIEVPA
ncbi:hypothetical protein SEA_ANDRIS_45 [Streptomyces phage Andris]|nr:hypothetical protein SEA_ANDRIS_45 [Streptomyces phage Andris]